MNDVMLVVEEFLVDVRGSGSDRNRGYWKKDRQIALFNALGRIVEATVRKHGVPQKYWSDVDTEEVAQSAVTLFLEKTASGEVDIAGPLTGYLVGIIRRVLCDYLRERPIVHPSSRTLRRLKEDGVAGDNFSVVVVAISEGGDDGPGTEIQDERNQFAHIDAVHDLKAIRSMLSPKQAKTLDIMLAGEESGRSRAEVAQVAGIEANMWKSNESDLFRRARKVAHRSEMKRR